MPDAQVMQLQTRRGSQIVAALIAYNAKDRPTVLFSHGNAVDLALMLPFYRHAAALACQPLGCLTPVLMCTIHRVIYGRMLQCLPRLPDGGRFLAQHLPPHLGCQGEPWRREIARELHVSILSYDYSGYGCSTGALSVRIL